MTTKSNALIRVCKTLEHAATVDSNDTAIDVWRVVLDIPKDGKRTDLKVSQAVHMLSEEFERGVHLLEESQVPLEAYKAPLEDIRTALSARGLGSNWNHQVRQRIQGAPLSAFKLASWLLPDDGSGAFGPHLAEITQQLEALEQRAIELKDNPDLRWFLLRELKRIRRALADYSILGVEAFTRAASEAFEARIADAEVIAKHAHSEEIGALDRLLNTINKVGEAAERWGRIASLVFGGAVATLSVLQATGMLPPETADVVKALQAVQQMKAIGPGTPPAETAPPEEPLSE